MPPVVREEVTEETKLVDLCVDEYAEKRGKFKCSLAECFDGMCVKHLKGYTEDTLKKHVMEHGGPDGLVPAWLEGNELGQYLKKSTNKAKDSEEAPGGVPSSCSFFFFLSFSSFFFQSSFFFLFGSSLGCSL